MYGLLNNQNKISKKNAHFKIIQIKYIKKRSTQVLLLNDSGYPPLIDFQCTV